MARRPARPRDPNQGDDHLRDTFARIHKTLRVTPAMEAGVADHVWSLEEIVHLTP